MLAGGVAESVNVTTTEKAPGVAEAPDIIPVVAAIVNPAGKPVADQL